ncbi:MAG TPA: prepilin-type N-terminal cleavage/methylation domain-containing protein [Chthoniobacteraceae bacterium]|nr:prepilin-type N-terminal cleavage/methylation domain-containing protein [Chthoniobacteraceae bacterium]
MNPRFHRGFSLIELLVAMSTLVLLLAVLLQIVSSSSLVIGSMDRSAVVREQAGLAFQRLRHDLERMVVRADVEAVLRNVDAGNDDPLIKFCAAVKSDADPADNRGLSIVSFRIAPDGEPGSRQAQPGLQRGVVGLGWSASDFMGIESTTNRPLSLPSVPASSDDFKNGNYDLLAPGVVRMGMAFITADGSISATPPAELRELTAMLVGLVILDTTSQALLTPKESERLAKKFPTLANGQTPLGAWHPVLSTLQEDESFPRPVVQNLRVFQELFEIPRARRSPLP